MSFIIEIFLFTSPPSAYESVNCALGKNLNSESPFLARAIISAKSIPSPLSSLLKSISSSSSASPAASNPARLDRPPIPAIFPRPVNFVPSAKPNLPNA